MTETSSSQIIRYLRQEVSIAPLITFRITFGLLMIGSIIRFISKGWINAQYLDSKLYFHYYGFDWIPHPGEVILYGIFSVMLLSAIGITLGYYYRIATISFFLSFSFVELLDKTFYLNHYYFIILVSFLLIFIPAHRRLSMDVALGRVAGLYKVPRLFNTLLKLQVGIVYFFAGIAKINADWLLQAMPMRIWLAANVHKPIIGSLLAEKWTAYLFGWVGMLYDTTIVFWLWQKRTRLFAFATVVVFHLMTGWLFPIGVFPFVMIGSSLLFFSDSWHERNIAWLEQRMGQKEVPRGKVELWSGWKIAISLYLLFQLTFPMRYLVYPGSLFWTEQGYRFSWRVMLIEKMGNATFYIRDSDTGKKIMVYNRDHLSPIQEKMMSTQPDMIIQYAKYLKSYWKARGIDNPIVNADIFVTLNGRRSKRFIDPTVDLASLEDGWTHKAWILGPHGADNE